MGISYPPFQLEKNIVDKLSTVSVDSFATYPLLVFDVENFSTSNVEKFCSFSTGLHYCGKLLHIKCG